MENLILLSNLIRERNRIEKEVFKITNQSFEIGKIGEFIASEIFNIELNQSFNQAGNDGYFKSGNLKGKRVNIKFYSKFDGKLDMGIEYSPDYYLVLAGSSKKEKISPWNIESIYLFNSIELRNELTGKVKIGTATSVKKVHWEKAMVYPDGKSTELVVDEKIREKIKLFSPSKVDSFLLR